MSLIVELEVPGVPESLTVVSTHLEDRAKSSCRRQQMGEIVRQVRSIPGPLVIGGDLNTSGTDGTPTSLGYEIKSGYQTLTSGLNREFSGSLLWEFPSTSEAP